MDAGDVKYREGDGGGGYGTVTSMIVAKVEDGPKITKGDFHEMGPSPALRKVSDHMKM